MAVLSVQNLKMEFADKLLFDNVSFEVAPKEKIGFIGSNASGKTTLFKLILGEKEPTGGSIFKGKNVKIGYLEQHACSNSDKTVYCEMESIFDSLSKMERELEVISHRITDNEGDIDALIFEQHKIQTEFENAGGLTYKSRTRSMLNGLGFTEDMWDMPCSLLSGGQRSKLALGKLLLSEPDLILLDEPTNHIDLISLEWLENFLNDFNGSAIIISHDRYFLDNVTTKTMLLDHERLKVYKGGYSSFLEQKTQQDEIDMRHYERQMEEVHRLEGIIEQQRRWRHYVTADSKQKMLDKKLNEIEKPEEKNKTLGFSFREVTPTGNEVLNLYSLSKSFDTRNLFKDVSFQVRKHDKAFLLGPNGSGKTTLLKILIGKESADSGIFEFGAGVKLGYFDQTLSSLDYNKSALDEIWDTHREFTETEVRKLLGQFLFRGDEVYKMVDTCSGGEKARLCLLKLMLSGANVLLLDEPTNHLDIPSREALEEALLDFGGTMIVVSHDRYFINKLSTRVLTIGMNGAENIEGGYDEYAKRLTQAVEVKAKNKTVGKGGTDYKKKKAQESELRKARTAVKKIEEKIEKIDEEIEKNNALLLSPEVSADYEKVLELTNLIDELNNEQASLMEEWEELETRKAELEELLE